MGNRANVYIFTRAMVRRVATEEPIKAQSGVYLYSHWGGDSLPFIVRQALDTTQERWGDTAYLTRAIFCGMVERDVMGLTGYGISALIQDNEHQIIVLDDDSQMIGFAEEPDYGDPQPLPSRWFTYKEYLDLTPKQIERVYQDSVYPEEDDGR